MNVAFAPREALKLYLGPERARIFVCARSKYDGTQ